MFLKVATITQNAVRFTKFFALIAETAEFFHEKGIEKGLFPAKEVK